MQQTATREPVCLAAPGFGAHAGFCSSDEAGAFFLTANHTTWHPNQDLKVSANGAPAQQVPVYYTVGWWNQTQPIELQLTKGKNSLTFTRTSTRELVFKEFLLARKKPDVPAPPGNFTPSPAPVFPNSSAYIEVAADTTCIKQGAGQWRLPTMRPSTRA